MTEADRAPALGRPSFRCPHCDAFTSQKWYGTIWTEASKKDSLPSLPGADAFEDPEIFRKLEPKNAKAQQSMMIEWRDKMRSGEPFFEGLSGAKYPDGLEYNLFISECYVCSRLSLWVGEKLVLPPIKRGVPPHADMPRHIEPDFEEARSIVDLSPRTEAANERDSAPAVAGRQLRPWKRIHRLGRYR
ncbi:MAG TPA: hypothetical protein VFU71_05440 [Burkholderiaceae bacterium]|nr:hypothetical protein [Burkholderiaceae bacterium]